MSLWDENLLIFIYPWKCINCLTDNSVFVNLILTEVKFQSKLCMDYSVKHKKGFTFNYFIEFLHYGSFLELLINDTGYSKTKTN